MARQDSVQLAKTHTHAVGRREAGRQGGAGKERGRMEGGRENEGVWREQGEGGSDDVKEGAEVEEGGRAEEGNERRMGRNEAGRSGGDRGGRSERRREGATE